jgi:hypothetical protein
MDRLQAVCERLAEIHVNDMKRDRDSNPDGEDMAFCAAENGLREYEYLQGLHMDFSGGFSQILKGLYDGDHPGRPFVFALIDLLEPEDKWLEEPEDEPVEITN